MNRLFELNEFKIIKYHEWFKAKYNICDLNGNKLMYGEDILWSWTSRYERTLFFEDKNKARKIFSIETDLSQDFTVLDESKQILGKIGPYRSNLSSFQKEPFWFLHDNAGEEKARICSTWTKTDSWEGPLFNFIFKSNDQILCELRCHTSGTPVRLKYPSIRPQVMDYPGVKAIIKLEKGTNEIIDTHVAISSAIFFFNQCSPIPAIEEREEVKKK